MTKRHKHADMIIAKAENMDLVNSTIKSDYCIAKKKYVKGTTKQVRVGQKVESVGGGVFKVVHIHSRFLCLVKFIDTGNLAITGCSNAKTGKVKNRYKRSLAGVGFLGYGKFNSKDHGKFYASWSNHLSSCYDDSHRDYHKYGALGWTVCEDWHNFQNFAEWCELTCLNGSLMLDKEYNNDGIKIICPEYCGWVTAPENIESGRLSKLNSNDARNIRGTYSLGGVSMRELAKRFSVDCSVISNIVNNKAWKNA